MYIFSSVIVSKAQIISSWLKQFSCYLLQTPIAGEEPIETHKCLEGKMSPGLAAFYLLKSTYKLLHLLRGCPDGVWISRLTSMRGDVGSNPSRETNFSFISETCVKGRLKVIYIFLSLLLTECFFFLYK